ncbi:DNA polymerase Y family protein [Devosia sp.]|uniref:Y-family DNA polymerase n=1 Tax=Devosia sp. TaxID=1871048 RepID=UPI003262D465
MVLNASATQITAQTGLLTERRYLALFLPDWPTDYLKRREPGLAGPLVLYERIKGGLRLAAVDQEAAKGKLMTGQNLADARAMLPNLTVREIDRPLLETAFADFADWHSNASPLVSVLTDRAAFGDLVLDITGVAHLFGGELDMLRLLLTRLRTLGYAVAGAVASTVGAAWAASHFARSQVVLGADTAAVLDTLPVAALRLDDEQVAGLSQMGLKRIGQLHARNRKALQARFGISLLTRLDQAYGRIEERLPSRIPVAERYAERRFADPIGLMDDVLMTARDLAITLSIQLETEGLGAQAFHLFLYRVDHKVMTLSVNSGRATRDPQHIARLFSNRSERLEGEYDPGFGVDMIRLAATSVDQLDALQLGAFETHDGTADLDRLYDRMSSRLGAFSVLRTKFVNTHIPEQAVRFEPAIARTTDDPLALPDRDLPRPLRLLPTPEAITVFAEVPYGPPTAMTWRRISYKFVKASGPERLGVEWWRSPERLQLAPPEPDQSSSKPADALTSEPEPDAPRPLPYMEGEQSRDYYIAEDDAGHRFWLFRQGLYGYAPRPDWFLQGFFS